MASSEVLFAHFATKVSSILKDYTTYALDETLLNDEKLAIGTPPSTPIILHVAGWDSLYYDLGLRRPHLQVRSDRWRRAETDCSTSTLIPSETRKLHLSSPFQTNPGINFEAHTLRSGFAHGFPLPQCSRKFCFSNVDGLLAEVQADSEDQKEMLSAIEAVGRWSRLLSWRGCFFTDGGISLLSRIGLLAPALWIKDDGTLYVELLGGSCEVARVCQDVLKGIGTVVSPTEGRSSIAIEDVKNITLNYYNSHRALLRLQKPEGNDARSFRRKLRLKMSSTLPLDALRVAAWSYVSFEEVHLWGTVDAQLQPTLARTRNAWPTVVDHWNGLQRLPSRHAIGGSLPRFHPSLHHHLHHRLSLLLYPESRWTANENESYKGSNDRPTLHNGLSDRGHHTLQNQKQHLSDTQNVETSDDSASGLDVCLKPASNPKEGWKPPLDHGSHPSITPPDRGPLPTTPARRPGIVTPFHYVSLTLKMCIQVYRRRPFGSWLKATYIHDVHVRYFTSSDGASHICTLTTFENPVLNLRA
ncbi:uncharacterized protein LACBIDRAFT_328188 [Laccaria bicolor S238N-H82]|uniref:Predicted protein n=1 Tax=Laccaria bicolor (strain S238N-H82 / ATCC MYA-4686) TaxID=486041 RepID=B0DE09_LACBS|nr:uncharacterized protein LACBIDRAFT_328188 [Laccaria bicolor S238N-H82]EDR07309.1 predicted protein [Laccaria bicolor S238N-H82]|eukprot:XP_001882240.1 predicted protein [Laccaria bicolor S238N-H82]